MVVTPFVVVSTSVVVESSLVVVSPTVVDAAGTNLFVGFTEVVVASP